MKKLIIEICCYDFALLERIRQFKVIVFIGKGWVISLFRKIAERFCLLSDPAKKQSK